MFRKLLFSLFTLLSIASSSAYDFKYDGLLYNIISEEDRTVEVTYQYTSSGYNTNYVSGDIEIPRKIIYKSRTYTVTAIGDYAFKNCPGLISVSSPNSVISIGERAFEKCSGLTSVSIPNSVTSIGDCAFNGCSSLTSVTIGNSVTSIGSYAFNECSSLISVSIPNSVTSIGEWAFRYCFSLTSVTIGNSVTSIGDFAFYGCSKLETFYVDPANIEFSSIDGILYNKDASTLLCCPREKTTVLIPNSVTSIGDYAFHSCSGLTSVTIPNSVTSIGGSAFNGCSSLTSVTIGNSVTSIGSYAFNDCSSLISVTIPNSVTYIGESAFYGCSGLTSVSIPNSVTYIGESAFYGCSGLTSVSIPNSVTSIGKDAFRSCTGLSSVTIPNSVTAIGSSAFYNCSRLETVYVQCEVPIECSPGFSDTVLKNAILYVPTGTLAAYEKVDPWRNFWNIEEMDYSGVTTAPSDNSSQVQLSVESGILTINGLDTGTHITIHDMQGRMVYSGTSHTISHLTPGLYILRTPNLTTKFSL